MVNDYRRVRLDLCVSLLLEQLAVDEGPGPLEGGEGT